MKIYPMTIEVAESNFRKFSQVALSSKEMSKSAFMKAEKQCELQYNSLGKTQNICEKLSSLVDELMKNGKIRRFLRVAAAIVNLHGCHYCFITDRR